MNRSVRHHYIPKFLTKNFTGEDGLLFVYNKATDRIIKSKQSPKAIFFEKNRNTVHVNGKDSDSLEMLYAQFDSKIAADIEKVLEVKTISPEQLVSIVLLANQLKWRVPSIDRNFNEVKENLTSQNLGVKISVKNPNLEIDERTIEFIEKSSIFIESKRVLLSLLPFNDEQNLLEFHENSFINSNPNFPALIGDSPVLEKPGSGIEKIGDLVFPLSSSDTFVFKKGTQKKLKNILFYFQRDLSIINSSSQYVGCKDKEYLERIVDMYNRLKEDKKLNSLERFLFDFVD